MLFACATTRAIYFDRVEFLSAVVFLLPLHGSVTGVLSIIHSKNGRPCKDASKYLPITREIINQELRA